MTTAVIEVRGLGVTYPGGVVALEPLDLCFETQRFTVLLGPSGAGKSTLLRCLNGLVRPTAGCVLSADEGELHTRASLRRHRKRTAMVFQQHQLIGRVSALRNVLTGRLAYHPAWRTLAPLPRADRELALRCLDRVGLVDASLRRAQALSGGQQQRVGVARALAQQPTLILADEPVASLDPATAERVLALLHDVCRADGISAIVSLHQVELAQRFADRIVGLAHGRIVFDGPPTALDGVAQKRIYGEHGPQAPAVAA